MAFNCLNFLKVHPFSKLWFQIVNLHPYTLAASSAIAVSAKPRRSRRSSVAPGRAAAAARYAPALTIAEEDEEDQPEEQPPAPGTVKHHRVGNNGEPFIVELIPFLAGRRVGGKSL